MSLRILTLAFALAACSGEAPAPAPEEPAETEEPAAEVDADVAKALSVANAPDKEQGLADAGLTVDQLDALMYKIAMDPDLSAAFEEGMQ